MVPLALLGPLDRISASEAAAILGCSVDTVRRHVEADRLHDVPFDAGQAMSRAEVEAMAAELYPWRRHVRNMRSYWVTGAQAADILGITIGRLDQLSDSHQIPFVRHEDRTRLYRRSQLELMPLRDRRLGG
jgi:hypothetical protein